MSTVEIPTNQLQTLEDAYPRESVSAERVALFKSLYKEGDDPPPIDVVALGDGTHLISDGVHRFYAARDAGRTVIATILIAPADGESPFDCAYRHAVETASKTALPLTYAERRQAVGRLLETRPDLSHRAIGRIIGISHDTVGRWARGHMARGEDISEAEQSDRLAPTATEISNRLVRYLDQLDASRDLFDYVKPSRMGRHLAEAFEDYHGDYALHEVRRIAQWVTSAVAVLEGGGE
jgi:hypothetical protein